MEIEIAAGWGVVRIFQKGPGLLVVKRYCRKADAQNYADEHQPRYGKQTLEVVPLYARFMDPRELEELANG